MGSGATLCSIHIYKLTSFSRTLSVCLVSSHLQVNVTYVFLEVCALNVHNARPLFDLNEILDRDTESPGKKSLQLLLATSSINVFQPLPDDVSVLPDRIMEFIVGFFGKIAEYA